MSGRSRDAIRRVVPGRAGLVPPSLRCGDGHSARVRCLVYTGAMSELPAPNPEHLIIEDDGDALVVYYDWIGDGTISSVEVGSGTYVIGEDDTSEALRVGANEARRRGLLPLPVMEVYNAHFTGALVAKCPECGQVCAYWDDDDLDEDGNLRCDNVTHVTV